MAPPPAAPTAAAVANPAEPVPVAVWLCAQQSGQYQRAGRHLPASTTHPGKMLPELARRIIGEYSAPGGLVVDPLFGIGTTLVEGALLGRRVLGVELEPRWAKLAAPTSTTHCHPSQPRRPRCGWGTPASSPRCWPTWPARSTW